VGIAMAGGYGFIAQDGLPFAAVDLTDPDNVTELSTVSHPGSGLNIALYEHYALMAASTSGLQIFDVADPNEVTLAGSCATLTTYGIAVSGTYAYSVGESGLKVLDVANNPLAPEIVGSCTGLGIQRNLAVRDTLAYTVGAGFHVINISDPAAPAVVGACTLPGTGYDVTVWQQYAYVADAEMGLRVIDIADPAHPVEIGHYRGSGNATGVAANGPMIYLADGYYFGLYELLANPGLTVTSPNGGEIWGAQSSHAITWASVAVPGNVSISLNRAYPDGPWEPLFASVPNSGNGSQIWNVRGPHSDACRIRIRSINDTTTQDISDADFSINQGEITLSPTLIEFGDIRVDSTAFSHFTVHNTGLDTLFIDSIAYGEPTFSVTDDWPGPILPGNSHSIAVGFTPSDTVAYVSQILVYSSAGDSMIAVTGHGAVPMAVSPWSSTVSEYRLYPCYPNPFNAVTTLSYDLPEPGFVSLRVFDALGRTAAVLTNGTMAAGNHRVSFDGGNLASGTYYARFETPRLTQTTKLVLLK
jgi:hypothetical protein